MPHKSGAKSYPAKPGHPGKMPMHDGMREEMKEHKMPPKKGGKK